MEFTPEELAYRYEVDVSVVRRSLVENGFRPIEVTEDNEYLVAMYVDYLKALKDAETYKDTFRYQDGEEMVDKSGVFDNFRRHYMDLLNAWERAKAMYDRSKHESEFGNFYIRQRAGHLDARRSQTSRRTFR